MTLVYDAANVTFFLLIKARHSWYRALSGDAVVQIHQVNQRFPSRPDYFQILSVYGTCGEEFLSALKNLSLRKRVVRASEGCSEED